MKTLAPSALCGLLMALASCRQIIGIEAADVDPALEGHDDSGSELGGTMSALAAGASPSSGGESASGQAGAPNPSRGGDGGGGATGGLGGVPDSSGGEGGAGALPTLCEQYCTAVTANCIGAFTVYTSYATCLAVCSVLPEGAAGDRTGNSVQCRLHAAQVAKDEVPHYCPIAGPGGNGVCGSNCESLCQLQSRVCSELSAADVDSCSTNCGKLQDLGNYSTDLDVGQYKGPHVQCRLYHLSAAAADNPEQHCPHVAGAAPCQ